MTTTLWLPAFLPDLLRVVQVSGALFAALGLVVVILRIVLVGLNAASTGMVKALNGWGHSPPRRAEGNSLACALRAGEEDMRMAWLQWHLRPGSTQRTILDLSSVSSTLAVVPRTDWSIEQFRQHGAEVWAIRPLAVAPNWRHKADARLDWMAAMVSDLTDSPFDTARGQTSEQYLFHQDQELRDAYLAGGSRATENIMATITAARARAREDAATEGTAAYLAQQRNAAFERLRNAHRPTRTRDAHAAWEAEAEDIGR